MKAREVTLPKEVYKEFEDIVGTENISEDFAVMDGYAFQRVGVRGESARDRFGNRPAAVILPGSTEEVQAILKVCNRRGISSKAMGTGYGGFNLLGSDGCVTLDMRRMNRILEFDQKNNYIVVEPYVSFAQVQAEVNKRGLNTHVIGAGSNCSFLASFTSVHGTSTQAISHSWSGRNVLGVEWVLPTGEVLKLGSLGSGAGWFSGDGPGPSLRGIMRGACGALGGLGVFTKVAGHLHPWPGPRKWDIKGVSPYYETELPPNFVYHMIAWPDWNKCAEGWLRISEAGIAYAMHKTGGPGSHGAIVCGSNNEYYAKWNELKDIPWVSFTIVMAANSKEESEWQVKVLGQILKDTEGRIVPTGEIPVFKNRDYINMIKACFIPRQAFRTAGSFACPLQGQETIDHCALALNMDKDFRKKYDEKGLLVNDGVNQMWGVGFEGGHFGLFECGHLFSPIDEDSWTAAADMATEGKEIALTTPLCFTWSTVGNPIVKDIGPRVNDFQEWMKKIKKAFDPNNASDPSGYIEVDEEKGKPKGSVIYPANVRG